MQAPRLSTLLLDVAKLDPAATLERLEAHGDGLTPEDAEARLETYGRNSIAREAKKSVTRQLAERLVNPLNVMLLVLVILNIFVLYDFESAGVVGMMVVLSVTLSYVQEYRSDRAAEKLRAMVSTTATVMRRTLEDEAQLEGSPRDARKSQRVEVPIEEVVPGDIIWLSAGDIIPADIRILAARDLFINQAALTGESLPLEKFPALGDGKSASALDLADICFMGSHVTSGTARAVVVLTGAQTYFGTLAKSILGRRARTSFEKGINRFTWLMIKFMLVMVPLVFLINGFTKHNWMEAFIFAMAVAVGLTPEMLPMIVTVNLSKGALAMSRKKVIVKRLNSIQNFGAMDVLCTDKTGTLTQDKVIMKRHVDLKGEDCDEVLQYAYLNSYYQSGLKNLLDIAVLEHAELRRDLHLETYAKIDEIPFDFSRRRMSVVVEKAHAQHILICKGAVEEIMNICTRGELGDAVFALDDTHRAEIAKLAEDLNEDGFRVVAVAHKEMPPDQAAYGVKDECDLTMIGFIAFLDPPKESARLAIAALAKYGVAVKVLTGDGDIVTRKICREVNLPVEGTLLGSAIENLTDQELAEQVDRTTVFAKLSPAQKARVIAAFHRNGHVVGFLGDGINDGPALKAADVGVSVDTAVDIAKESADIILLEKNLLVLEEGVLEGRKVFGNITKYIKMGASSNFGNMFSVLGASAWLPFLPMAPIQVLTNNLLYDFSQTAIPTDNIDEDYLTRPRQWNIRDIAKFMVILGPVSSIFDYLTYVLMYFGFGADTPAHAALFQTGWFVESILTQTLIIHVIRTAKIPFLQSRASIALMFTSLIICAVGAWLPSSPFAHALGFTELPGLYWLAAAAIVPAYLLLANAVKLWFIRKFGWN
ncbi:MAG TPA: magnesium-translocating P-type ATPase [Alphaproteobacteria bacterium]|nr:magnesium-translocating P-type ATPase [Alphaproteobacteria bacterium]